MAQTSPYHFVPRVRGRQDGFSEPELEFFGNSTSPSRVHRQFSPSVCDASLAVQAKFSRRGVADSELQKCTTDSRGDRASAAPVISFAAPAQGRTKLPESLWQAAVEPARQHHGAVAHPLQLDYGGPGETTRRSSKSPTEGSQAGIRRPNRDARL